MRATLGMLALCMALVAHGEPMARAELSRTTTAIQHALAADDFARVEALHAEAVGKRLDDGTWLLEAFEYAAVQFQTQTAARWEAAFAEWKEKIPASRLRPIVQAYFWEQRASVAHGAACAAPDAAGKPLAARLLERAERALREADPAASPLHGSIALRIAGAQGRGAAELDALLASAIEIEPAFLPVYWSRGRFMLPPWSREFEAFDRFARERVPGGDVGYALLYATVARDTCGQALEETAVSWDRMRDGLKRLARERDTPWTWNLLGTFACRFRDHETTIEVLARMGDRAQLGIWSSGQSTASCRRMIQPPVPARTQT